MDISFDFEYQLRKSRNFLEKKVDRRMKQFRRIYGNTQIIMKLISSPGNHKDDLEPFVIYSLNRKNRWKILSDFQNSLVHREFSGIYRAVCANCVHTHFDVFEMTKIKKIPKISSGISEVSYYNVIQLPENYQRIWANKDKSNDENPKFYDFMDYFVSKS
ncbi:unnamed protein product [Caenorhabditis angaria]|uniref:Uncharacterized protein n=1 Tax=Caenorhabditis angaria TaxID=860376 RepID=A0A9P1J0K0_9PELO|nr:unnamed protein product [Caenorhabditis angaria]